MKNSIKTLFAKSALALTLGIGAVSTPALAGGQLSIDIAPRNADQEQWIRAGLGIYGLVNKIENGTIRQKGSNNSAGLRQNGSNNFGVVHQDGERHNGTVTQNGDDNAYGLFQFGQGSRAQIEQNGGGRTGLGFTYGW